MHMVHICTDPPLYACIIYLYPPIHCYSSTLLTCIHILSPSTHPLTVPIYASIFHAYIHSLTCNSPSIHPYTLPSIHLSVLPHAFRNPSSHLSIRPCNHPFLYPYQSFYPSTHPSLPLGSINLSSHPSFPLIFHPSIRPPICPATCLLLIHHHSSFHHPPLHPLSPPALLLSLFSCTTCSMTVFLGLSSPEGCRPDPAPSLT